MFVSLHAAADRAVAVLSAGGPWIFFGAWALLPAFGIPCSPFALAAGTVFAPRMGMPAVVAAGLAATGVNLAFTYALARGPLREILQRLIARMGHRLPEIGGGDATDLIVVARVSPLPFFVKNYLLGLANAPVGKYLLISALVEGAYTTGFILFGDALLHGRGRMIALAGCLIVAAVALTHFARRHYGTRRATDAART